MSEVYRSQNEKEEMFHRHDTHPCIYFHWLAASGQGSFTQQDITAIWILSLKRESDQQYDIPSMFECTIESALSVKQLDILGKLAEKNGTRVVV